MYIKMAEDKSLHITIPASIYRGENQADLLVFLLPELYEDVRLADCVVAMRYILPTGEGFSEELVLAPELYRTYCQFGTKVDTQLTAVAGDITVWLTAIDGADNEVLKTGEVTITVLRSKNIADYMPQESLDQIDRLTADVEKLKKTKADNIIFNEANSTIQLTAGGMPIGDQVYVCANTAALIIDMKLTEDGHLIAYMDDGSEKDLGVVVGKDGAVYIPHLDDHKVLSFTIEDAPGEIPDPVDLNPSDEWSSIGDAEVKTDYLWEKL